MVFMAIKAEMPAVPPKHDLADLSIATVGGLALAFTLLFLCVLPLTNIAGERDFVVFWATGQQLVHHASPYDKPAMTRIERAAGLPAIYDVGFMRNPPWALPLALPLGFIGLRAGAFLWSLILLTCLLASVRILWKMHGRPKNQLHWLGLSFAPALLSLAMGQTSLLALMGYVLFLRLHSSRPFLAGAALWLCALKPHLFIPFGLVLLAWVFVSKSYKVLAGAAVALAASVALTWCIDPAAFSGYAQMMRSTAFVNEFIPCLSVVLRFWLSRPSMWIQYILPAAGCLWALGYYWTRRSQWDWMQHGSLLILVSLIAAPYFWLYDGGLAIPALLHGAFRTRSRRMLVLLAFASLLIEAELIGGIKIHSIFFLWTAPAWLVWYLFATGKRAMRATGILDAAERPEPAEGQRHSYAELSPVKGASEASENSSVSPI
jgi:hypothetical protein